MTKRRSWLAGLAAAALVVLVPGVAQADPPSNDDFDGATAITSLPFTATANSTAATKAPDDPASCYYYNYNSVWFSYTAAQDGIAKATVSLAGDYPILSAYTGVRGDLALVPGVCAFGSGSSEFLHVTAGTTYYFLVGANYGHGGDVSLRLESVPPSPNDDIAGAQAVPGLPSSATGDLSRAGAQAGEPVPSCGDTATQSVWYAYTPASPRWVAVSATGAQFVPALAVYRGSELSEVDCQPYRTAVFRAEVGQMYYIRVAAAPADAGGFTVDFKSAPALKPVMNIYPNPASVLSDVLLAPFAGDPYDRPIASGVLNFGDGTSAPVSSGVSLQHRYTVDGDYRLELTVTTDDGRTGTGTTTLRIETHDVTVTGFSVPAKARVDQTKPISVTVANTRRDETVTVELLRWNGSYFSRVGTLTQSVLAGHTVQFPFAYTFGAEDSVAGTVTFKAIATVVYPGRDDNAADNERVATTAVRP